jgi:multidrug resistance efflux pump
LEINKFNPGAVSASEVRRLLFSWHAANLQTEAAELELSLAKLTAEAKQIAVDAAELEIERRKIRAPVDGVVDRILVRPGEWMQPGQPLIEIARIDKLRVEAFLNAYEVSPRDVEGRNVTIDGPVANGEKETFTGKIGFVSSVVVADGAYRVWVEFDNRKVGNYWVVRPGLTANMAIHVDEQTTPVAVKQK